MSFEEIKVHLSTVLLFNNLKLLQKSLKTKVSVLPYLGATGERQKY